MRKFTFFFKSLLVAAGLLLGSANAWGGVKSTIYERGQSTLWSTSDYTTESLTSDKWYSKSTGNTGVSIATVSDVNYLHISARGTSTTGTSTLTLSRTANTIVTIDAVMNTGSSQFPNNDNRITFKYGAFTLNYYTRNSNAEYYINSTKTSLPTLANNIDLTIHLVVNSVDGKISALKVTRGDTSEDIVDIKETDEKSFDSGTNYDKAIFEAYNNVSSNNTSANMKSFVVQQETQDVATASVTFKYADTEGNSLSAYKADQVASGVAVGAEISSLISAYTTTFYNGTSNKYVYANSYVVTGDYTTVQDGGNTVTLKFTDYPATAYTVMAQEGGSDLTSIASGTAYLDGSTTAYYSKYVKYNNQWYETSSPYGVAVSAATTNVAYTTCETNDIYDVIECENTSYNSAGDGTGTGYSKGKTVLLASGKAMQTNSKLPVGIYDFSVFNSVRRSNVDRLKLQYSINGSDWTDLATLTFPSNDGTTQTAEKVVLAEDSYVRFLDDVGQNSCHYYDYILIKKYVSVTISAAGWATFSSDYPLDFSKATTGLEAYMITGHEGNVVTKSQVTGTVPAGTGLLLKGDEGDYNIPVVASSSTDVSANLMKAGTGASVSAEEGKTKYVLGVNDNGTDGDESDDFAEFQKIGLTAATVDKGKAYLEFNEEISLVKAFMIDGTATGVEAPVAAEAAVVDGIYYNLNGQQVTKDYKGIVIVNGKKFLNK